MNRSQRCLQQLKQTVAMKLAILEKQKEDIKEVIDDYSAQIVAKVEHLLGNELDLLQNPEQCHEIIQSLDKASQVFTDVVINLDILLDAADSKHVSSTAENEPVKSNKFVTSEKEDSKISDSSKSSLSETDRSGEQINYTTHSQFENEIQQCGVITDQQAQFTESGSFEKQSGSFEKQSGSFEKQSQKQQEHLKNHAILSGSPLNISASDTAVQEITTTGPNTAHCSSDRMTAETLDSYCDSSLHSSLISATSSLPPSEIISNLMPNKCTMTQCSDSTSVARIDSSRNDAVFQFQGSCNNLNHTWNSNNMVAEHYVGLRPLISALTFPQNPHSVSVCSGNPVFFPGIPTETSGQPPSFSLISDHCGRIVHILMDAGPLSDATSVPPLVPTISPSCSQSLGECVNSQSFCYSISTEQSVVKKPKQTLNHSLRLREPMYPLSQCSSSDLSIVSTVLPGQQPNTTQTALTSIITDLTLPTTAVSESSGLSPEISSTSSAISNLSMSSSSMQQHCSNLSSSTLKSVQESNKENMEGNRSKQPHLLQAQKCMTVSSVSKTFPAAVLAKKTLSGSVVTKNSQQCTQDDNNSISSHVQLEVTAAQVPKTIRSLRIKRNVKRSSGSRNLNELIKEVEKAATEKSAKVNKLTQVKKAFEENVSAEVLKAKPIAAVSETLVSPAKEREPGLEMPCNTPQTTLSSGRGDIQENILESHATEVKDVTIGTLQLEKNSVFSALVSNLIHPWSFHVQFVGLIQVISGLITHAVNTGATAAIKPFAGLFCLAKSCDHNYYRARVLSLEESQDGQKKNVKVIFIDYGIRKVVFLADVCSIPEYLVQYPSQAIFCALHKVGPKNSNCLWTEEAILEFQQYIKDKEVQVRVVYPSPSETELTFPHIVDVMVTEPKTPHKDVSVVKSMAEYLIEGNFAKDMQAEEHIAALWQMYTPDKHNAGCAVTEFKVGLANEKPQPVNKTKLDVHLKGKVLHRPLCFKQGKAAKTSLSSEPSATKSALSTSSYSGSVSDSIDLPQAMTLPHTEDKYELSILVDVKLHSRCADATSYHIDGRKVTTERNIAGEGSELYNFPDDSEPLLSKTGAEVRILVMISRVISPSSFFVHHVDKDFIHQLQTLEEELLKLSTAFSKDSASFVPARNSLVCVTDLTETNCYRGLVLDIESEEDQQGSPADDVSRGHKFLIFFIDYGDFEWAPGSRILPLPTELQKLAPSVVWCTLKGVQPLDPTKFANIDGTVPLLWSRDVVDVFKSMVMEKKVFSAILTEEALQQINNTDTFQCEPVPVFLLDQSLDDVEVCLNHELICLNLASLRPSAPEFDQNRNIPEWDPMTEEFTSIRNSYKVDTEDAGVALVGHTATVPKEGQKVCVHFNRPKGCLRGDLCPDRHVEVDLCDVPYGKVPVKIFDEDESDLLPQPGSSITVTVSAVFTPSLFYVTLPSKDLTLQQLHDPLVRSQHCQKETLESMMASMQEFYSNHPGYDGDLTLLAPGEAMAAKVQGKWVRAKVIFTDVEHGLVQVVLVDYGCVDWVSERDLRELGLQFLHLTPQAIECCLVDLEPPNETCRWSEETCKHFAEMVKGKTLLAWVKHRYPSGKIGIVLLDTSEKRNINVNQQLEDSGLAHHPVAVRTVETYDKSLAIDDGHRLCFMPA